MLSSAVEHGIADPAATGSIPVVPLPFFVVAPGGSKDSPDLGGEYDYRYHRSHGKKSRGIYLMAVDFLFTLAAQSVACHRQV